jgi:hypothetical protein
MPIIAGRLLLNRAGGGEAHGRAETVVAITYAAFGLAFTYGRRTPARSFPPPPHTRQKASGYLSQGRMCHL